MEEIIIKLFKLKIWITVKISKGNSIQDIRKYVSMFIAYGNSFSKLTHSIFLF